jgi:TatD DNase family protein
MAPRWIDSHCHLQDADDLSLALTRAREVGVEGFICIGTTEETSREAVRIATEHAGENVWATVGLHPHEASAGTASVASVLAEHASGERRAGSVVAVGECGLDYHYEYSPRDAQRQSFAEQIALAKELDLCLVIHTREAWDDTFEILTSEGVPQRTVIHCFTGGVVEARRCVDLGAYLSFSGIVTFKNANDVRDAAVYCPDDRLIVETDAPYLAPVPYRGKPNEPSFVSIVGSAVAELRGCPSEDLAELTRANTVRAFELAR